MEWRFGKKKMWQKLWHLQCYSFLWLVLATWKFHITMMEPFKYYSAELFVKGVGIFFIKVVAKIIHKLIFEGPPRSKPKQNQCKTSRLLNALEKGYQWTKHSLSERLFQLVIISGLATMYNCWPIQVQDFNLRFWVVLVEPRSDALANIHTHCSIGIDPVRRGRSISVFGQTF